MDPLNLEDGSLLCSSWLNCQKAGTSSILSALLSILHGCSSVQCFLCKSAILQSQRPAAPTFFCPPLPWGAPPPSKATLSALLLWHKAREGSWNTAGRTLHCYRCGGPGWGLAAWVDKGVCSPLPDLALLAEWSQLPCWKSQNLDYQSRQEASDRPFLYLHLPRRLGTRVSSGCAVPVPQGRHTARAVPHLSELGTLTLPWHGGRQQIICTESTSPPSFPSEAIVYLSPLALAWSKLQSKAAENSFCVWSLWCGLFFPLLKYSTCSLKIYIYTISAADMVFLLLSPFKLVIVSFCYLPNFFYFDNIFLALHNPCENCKYLWEHPFLLLATMPFNTQPPFSYCHIKIFTTHVLPSSDCMFLNSVSKLRAGKIMIISTLVTPSSFFGVMSESTPILTYCRGKYV